MSKLPIRALVFLILVISLWSCKSTKVNSSNNNDIVFCTLERTPCFGRCPVYSIKIYESGLLLYKGQRNVQDTFCHSRQISKSELTSLKSAFAEVDFMAMKSSYPFEERAPVDLPSCIIFFKSNNQEKTVTDHHWKSPENLAFLERKIDSLANPKFLQFWDK